MNIVTTEPGHTCSICHADAAYCDLDATAEQPAFFCSVHVPVCACFYTCGMDSHSGEWHQHEDEPCPFHAER